MITFAGLRWLAPALTLALAAAAPARASDPDEFHLEWSWSQWGDNPGMGEFLAANLDRDPRPELLVTAEMQDPPGDVVDGRWYIVDFADGAFRQVWSSFAYPTRVEELAFACAGQACEIVVGTDLGIDVFDSMSRDLARTVALDAQELGGLEVTELDGAPGRELVSCDRNNLYLHDFESLSPLAVRYGFGCSELAVADVDGDFELELVLAGNPFGLLVLDAGSLEIEWSDPGALGRTVAVVDLDGDGVEDLVYQLQRQPLQGVRARSLVTGTVLWERTEGFWSISTGDLDPAPGPEVVLVGGDPIVLAGDTGVLLWSPPWGSVSGSAARIADLDGNGVPELVVAADGPARMVTVDPLTHDVAVESADYRPADVRAGDADADGANEIVTVVGGSQGPRFLVFDVATRTIEYEGDPLGFEYQTTGRVALGQLDQDGQLELCTQIGIGYEQPTLHCQDGLDHFPHWVAELPSFSYATGLAAVDLDGDQAQDMLSATEDATLLAFDGPTGSPRWVMPTTVLSSFDRILGGDVEGDGGAELIVGGPQDEYPFWARLTIFDPLTGAIRHGPFGEDFESFALAELNGTPPAELLVLERSGELGVLDPISGALSPPLAVFPEGTRALAVADLTRDGVLDFAVAAAGRLHVHDGSAGTIIWSSPYVMVDAGDNDSLTAGDADQNGVPDLLLGTRAGFLLVEAPHLPVFADGFESGDTSAWSSTVP